MLIETRIFQNIRKNYILLEEKFSFFKKNFSISILFLFIGFFLGNIFGTFLNWLRHFIAWDGFLIFGLLFFFEIISSIVYQNNFTFLSQSPNDLTNKNFFSDFFVTKNVFLKINLLGQKLRQLNNSTTSTNSTIQKNLKSDHKKFIKFLAIYFYFLKSLPIWRFINCLKVGILFGFFIDAFKVGS